jgi:hypothetical protein
MVSNIQNLNDAQFINFICAPTFQHRRAEATRSTVLSTAMMRRSVCFTAVDVIANVNLLGLEMGKRLRFV